MKIKDLSLWEAFYWVAVDKSFSAAARRLKLGTPQLSKRVSALEEQLEVRLFTRSTRKLTMTQEGAGLLPRVKLILEDAQDLEERFQQKDSISGTIKMTCITAFAYRILTPLLAEFSRLHQGISFEVNVTDSVLDLIDTQMDLAIRVQNPSGSDFVFKKLLRNDLCLCAAPAYLKSTNNKPLQKPSDLQLHTLLSLKVYENCSFKNTSVTLSQFTNTQKIYCENGLILSELACLGAGIAVRSRWDVQALIQANKLVEVLPDFPLEHFGDVYAVIPSRRLLAYRVRSFLDFLLKNAKGW